MAHHTYRIEHYKARQIEVTKTTESFFEQTGLSVKISHETLTTHNHALFPTGKHKDPMFIAHEPQMPSLYDAHTSLAVDFKQAAEPRRQ